MSTQSNRAPQEAPDTNVKQMIYVPPEVDTAMRRHAFENGVTLSAAYVRAARAMILETAATMEEDTGLGPNASTPANRVDFVTRGEFEALVENLRTLSGKIDSMASGHQSSGKVRSKASRAVKAEEPKVEVAKRLIMGRLAGASEAVHGGELDRLVESHGFKKSLAATAKNDLLRGGHARRDGARWTLGMALQVHEPAVLRSGQHAEHPGLDALRRGAALHLPRFVGKHALDRATAQARSGAIP